MAIKSKSVDSSSNLQDTIIEIKKPYQNWPKWLVGVINFVLNLFRKNKKEVGK